jgi:hypothetical protein
MADWPQCALRQITLLRMRAFLSMTDIRLSRRLSMRKCLVNLRAGFQEIYVINQAGFGCLGSLGEQGAGSEHRGEHLGYQALTFFAGFRVGVDAVLEFENLLDGFALASKQIDYLGSTCTASRARVVGAQ